MHSRRYHWCLALHFVAQISLTYKSGVPILAHNESKFLSNKRRLLLNIQLAAVSHTHPMFKHFLLTRFNLALAGADTDKSGRRVHDDAWMEHRLSLFKQFCLPSVQHQRCRNFHWLILLHAGTKPRYLDMLQVWTGADDRIRLVLVPEGTEFVQTVIARICQVLSPADEFVITTRMDNDDMIRDDFMERVQALFQPQDKWLIDQVRGWQLGLYASGACVLDAVNRYNPFISLVERADRFGTVFAHPHNQWPGKCTYVSFDEEPVWVEMVHDRNIDNRLRGGRRHRSPHRWERFGIGAYPFHMEPAWETWIYNTRRFAGLIRRRIRSLIRKGVTH
jgi:hypothetical protein